MDKVLKVQAPDETVTIWSIDEPIQIHEKNGKFVLVLSSGTYAQLAYVDESALNIALDVSDLQTTYYSTILKYSQNPTICDAQNALGVRFIHLNLINTRRNTTNELLLKYEIVCSPYSLKPRTQDLRSSWKHDPSCPAPTTIEPLTHALYFRQYFSSIGPVNDRTDFVFGTELSAGSQVTAVYTATSNGTSSGLNVTSSNTDVVRILDYKQSISGDSHFSFAIVQFETLKPGDAIIRLMSGQVGWGPAISVIEADKKDTTNGQTEAQIHEACKKHGRDLVMDKVLKVQAPNETVTIWSIDEPIQIHEKSGRIVLAMGYGTHVQLSHVDESALKVSVSPKSDNRSAIIEFNQNPANCEYQNALGVRYIHLNLFNKLRNTTNELLLKYQILCHPFESRSQDIRTSMRFDPSCPAPATPEIRLRDIFFQQYFSTVGSVQTPPPNPWIIMKPQVSTGSSVLAAVVFETNRTDYNFQANTSNPEAVRILNYTKSISGDTEFSFFFFLFETLKPGVSIIHFNDGRDWYNFVVTVVDGMDLSSEDAGKIESFTPKDDTNEQSVSAIYDACKRYGNELVYDKILKFQAPDNTVSVWDIDEPIQLHKENGRIALALSWGTHAYLSYVDESALRASVSRPSHESAIIEYYQNSRLCEAQNALGVRYIHLILVNKLRNTTNELVLKYEIVCHELEARTQETRVFWKYDGNCPTPTTKPTEVNPNGFFYQFFSSPGSVEISPDHAVGTQLVSGSHVTAAYFLKEDIADCDFYLTPSNPEAIRVLSQTKSLNFSTGYSLAVVNFETLKPGRSNITLHYGNITHRTFDGVTVLPSFSEFWNRTVLRQVDLDDGDAHMIKVFVDSEANGLKEFYVNGDGQSFDIKTRLSNGTSWLYFVVKGNKEPLSIEASSDIHAPYITTTNQMNHHVATIPFDFPRRNIPNEIMKVKLTGSGISQEYTLNITLLDGLFVLEQAIYNRFGNGAHLNETGPVIAIYTIEMDKTGRLEAPITGDQEIVEIRENVTGLVVVGRKELEGFVATLTSEGSSTNISIPLQQKTVQKYNFPNIKSDFVYFYNFPFRSETFDGKPGNYKVTVRHPESGSKGHRDIVIKENTLSYLHE